MDPIDYQIIDLLQRDARTTQVQIASSVGLSQPSVADRIRKLEAAGIVQGYVARVDARAVGNDIRAFVGVRIAHPRHNEGFIKRIQQIPEVLECHRVAGLDSYELKVVTRNTEALDDLISDILRRIPGVTRTTTTIVLATLKDTTAVPLPDAPQRKGRKEPSP